MKLGFLASHNGSNMQAVIDACKSGYLTAFPAVVVSNNAGSRALQRAEAEKIPHYHICAGQKRTESEVDAEIFEVMCRHEVDLIVLAGYMKMIGPKLLAGFSGRIINIHPALLPKYGGKGMYGIRVHEAVIAAREKKTGVTIHIVDEHYDHGRTLAQTEVEVRPEDTPELLAARVLETEHRFLVETLKAVVEKRIPLEHGLTA